MSASRRTKRSVARSTTVAGAVAGIAGLTLTGPFGAAAAAATGESGAPQVVNRETVQAQLDPSGKVETARLYSQLTVLGTGTVDVADPTSAKNVRDLDGFSAPTVRDGKAQYSISVDGREDRRTLADFTGELPVTIEAQYTLDGEPIDPEDVVGKSGRLEATYTVVNRTARDTEVTYKDHTGADVTETVSLVAPYVGSLKVLLPAEFSAISADSADVAGDGRGANGVSWSMVLFDPLGEPAQRLTWTADVEDAVLPPATLQVVPVVPGGNSVLQSGLSQIGEGATAATTLTAGAYKIDGKLLELRDGATKILDGLTKLSDGAKALNAGLADTAAPGAQTLSDGLGAALAGGETLAAGLGSAREGGQTLAAGLGSATEGGKALTAGLGQLTEGGKALDAGLTSANAGGKALSEGLDKLVAGGGRLIAGLDSAAEGGKGLAQGLGTLEAGLGTAKAGSGELAAGLTAASTGAGSLATGLPELAAGLDQIQAGLTDLKVKLPAGLADGLAQVQKGVRDASAGYIDGALVPGIDAIKASIHNESATEPGAVQKLSCAETVLNDVVNGTLTPVGDPAAPKAGTFDACYFDKDTNPAALTPPMAPMADGLGKGLVSSVSGKLGDAGDALGTPTDTSNETLLGGLNGLRAGLDNTPSAANPQPGLKQALLGGVNPGIDKVYAGVTAALSNALGAPTTDETSPLAKTLIGGTSLLAAGADAAAGGSGELAGGLEQLAEGGLKLDGGLAELLAGSTSAAAGAMTLSGGLDELASGGGELAAGAGAAADGARALSGGIDQLAAGGGRLVAGLDAANEGGTKLVAGLGQLDDGGAKLVDGLGQLDDGGAKLVDGLGQLDDGGAKLAAGLQDAADGSGQLVAGVDAVADGVTQVEDGATRLSGEGSSLLAGQANTAAKAAGKNVAILQAMAERGAAEALPYGAPEGAEGTSAFSLVLAGANSDASDSTTRGAAALALLTLGSLSGYVMRRRFVS